MMGYEEIVYLTLADSQELIARIDPRSRFTPGETVRVSLDMNCFHLFDRASEQVLHKRSSTILHRETSDVGVLPPCVVPVIWLRSLSIRLLIQSP